MKIVPLLLALVVAPLAQSADLAPTGTLRASFIENNPNQGRVDPTTKAITGPAADLVRELARRLGVKHEITPLPSAGAVLESVRDGNPNLEHEPGTQNPERRTGGGGPALSACWYFITPASSASAICCR